MGVDLPQELYEGNFSLVAYNAVGSDQVSVQILRGEQGPPGPDMTGDQLIATINTGATTQLTVAVLPSPNDLINDLNTGSVKIDPGILPPASGGTSYTGDDIVNLINNGATTTINAGKLATADTLLGRINGAVSTLLAVGLLPIANDLISRINGGDGSVKLSSTVLPAATGAMTGTQIVSAINAGGTSGQINAGNIATGTTGTTVALGNHTHDASAIVSGTIAYARLPVGTAASTVAAGNHTHDASAIVSGTIAYARLPVGTTAGTVAAGNAVGLPYHLQALPNSWNSGVTISGTDLTTVKTMCGDPGGCTIQIGVRHSSAYFSPTWYDLPAIMYGPPCRLHIDSANNWTLSPWCIQTYEVNNPPGTGVNDSHTTREQPYASDQFDTLGGGYGTYILLQYYVGGQAVCTLSEGAPPSGSDDGNLHFWMEQASGDTSFQNASRTCELHITQ